MKKFFALALALCSSLLLQAAKVDKKVTITVGDKTREYWLYVPSSMKDNCALVLSLHGAGGNSTDKAPFTTGVADKAGCIVAYPQVLLTTFPGLGGMQANGWSAYGEENFDTDFLKAIVEDIASKYTIDCKRLYCCPEEVAAISAPHKTSVVDQTTYSLSGQKLNGTPHKTGVYVKKGRKYVR